MSEKTYDIQSPTLVLYNRTSEGESLGSGVIVEIGGIRYGLTNAHCVQHVKTLSVETFHGEHLAARVVAMCNVADVAVLTIDGLDDALAFPAVIGDSDWADVRDTVDACGSPLESELKFTITRGIISRKSTFCLSLLPALQIDARINPGNSGGGLFNLKGELIGLNSSIIEGSGIGFALKINDVMRIARQLLKYGGPVSHGVMISDRAVNPLMAKALGLKNARGVVVDAEDDRCPTSGTLMFGDVVLAIDGIAVENRDSFAYLLQRTAGSQETTFTVLRKGAEQDVFCHIPALINRNVDADAFDAFGMSLTDVPGLGLVVVAVEAGSPAEQGEVAPGMIIAGLWDPDHHVTMEVADKADFYLMTDPIGDAPIILDVEEEGQDSLCAIQRKPD